MRLANVRYPTSALPLGIDDAMSLYGSPQTPRHHCVSISARSILDFVSPFFDQSCWSAQTTRNNSSLRNVPLPPDIDKHLPVSLNSFDTSLLRYYVTPKWYSLLRLIAKSSSSHCTFSSALPLQETLQIRGRCPPPAHTVFLAAHPTTVPTPPLASSSP